MARILAPARLCRHDVIWHDEAMSGREELEQVRASAQETSACCEQRRTLEAFERRPHSGSENRFVNDAMVPCCQRRPTLEA